MIIKVLIACTVLSGPVFAQAPPGVVSSTPGYGTSLLPSNNNPARAVPAWSPSSTPGYTTYGSQTPPNQTGMEPYPTYDARSGNGTCPYCPPPAHQ